MDVKNLKSSLATGTAIDANKDQDTSRSSNNNNESHPRTLQGKEPDTTKSNAQPRYNIQKTKNFVKRQKSKGQYHGSTEENTKVVNKLPERDSVLVSRSRKENGNHLLNFRCEQDKVEGVGVLGRDGRRYNRKYNRLIPPVQQHKYNKEQFVQSSCQFVVSPWGDYSLHLTNPDILVDWKLIEQVKFYSSENLFCPICLFAPIASRITRCGHIYCWSCILCYLYVSDDHESCRCPICYQYVHKSDLKSVIVITQSTFALGDVINLRLMRRKRNSLFVTSVEPAIYPPTTFLSVSENDNKIYSKLLIANTRDIMNIIKDERFELEGELQKNPDMFDYIKEALDELSKRKKKLQNIDVKFGENENALLTEVEIVEETSQENNSKGPWKNDIKSVSKQSLRNSNDKFSSGPSEFFYFYQAEDGQHVYLHPINVKMLEMQYNNLKNCPSIIRGRLLEKEASIYTQDLRRRLRYLYHLPLNSPFELVEIELGSPLVSPEIFNVFQEQLNSRRKRREQKKREENKRQNKITEDENRLIGIYPTPNIDIKSYQEFPEWQPEQLFKDCVPSSSSSSELAVINGPSVHSSVPTFETISSNTILNTFDEINNLTQETNCSQEQSLTFAAILTRTRNKPANPWQSIKSKKRFNSVNGSSENKEMLTTTKTYNKSTTVWPSLESHNCSGTPSNDENEKETYVREQKSEFPEIQQKLPKAMNNGDAVGKKKKKGKGIILFQTGMTSRYS